MFGNVAQSLLKMMGQSGNVPGAVLADDVADALAALQTELDKAPEEAPQAAAEDSSEDSNKVALRTRAIPLIELLESAVAAGENVLWES